MRQTTRRKYYGRSAIAQALRSAIADLTGAITEAEKPADESPLAAQLRKVAKSIDQAIEAERIYALQRKKIKTSLEQERKHIQALLDTVMDVAVLPEEKAVQKRAKSVPKPTSKRKLI